MLDQVLLYLVGQRGSWDKAGVSQHVKGLFSASASDPLAGGQGPQALNPG